jgi:tRNA G18 (ribose-2'-O)-methylase SpoU
MAMNGSDISELKQKEKSIIVLGNEGNGVCNEILDKSQEIITIKKSINSQGESLNVANACAIALFYFT